MDKGMEREQCNTSKEDLIDDSGVDSLYDVGVEMLDLSTGE